MHVHCATGGSQYKCAIHKYSDSGITPSNISNLQKVQKYFYSWKKDQGSQRNILITTCIFDILFYFPHNTVNGCCVMSLHYLQKLIESSYFPVQEAWCPPPAPTPPPRPGSRMGPLTTLYMTRLLSTSQSRNGLLFDFLHPWDCRSNVTTVSTAHAKYIEQIVANFSKLFLNISNFHRNHKLRLQCIAQ